MGDRAIGIGGDVSRSVVVTGDRNTVRLSFGDSGVVLGLLRKHVRPPDRRRVARSGEPPRELDLLDPERGALPLVGRADMMQQLRAWIEAETDVSVYALIGRAGSGKTRLALALCEALDPAESSGPWHAGFLSGTDLAAVTEALATRDFDWAGEARVLAVVDHAGQCHQALVRWLDRLAYGRLGEARLRILLLEREAPQGFGWWHALTQDPNRRDLFHTLRPEVLPDLADLEERRRLAGAAHDAAARMRPAAAPGGIPAAGQVPGFDRDLAKTQFGNPLNLVMAGVLALDQGPAAALGLRRLDAARRLGERELERFGQIARASRVSVDAMRHAVAFNAMLGGLPVSGLPGVLAGELDAAKLDSSTCSGLASLLEQELPPRAIQGAEPGGIRLGTIQPDLIAEAATVAAFTGEAWRQAEGPKALRRAYGLDPHRSAASLMKLLQDFAYAIEDRGASEEERAAAVRLLGWLTALVEGVEDPAALAPIANAFPTQTLVLREAAAQVQMRVAEACRVRAMQGGRVMDAALAAAALNDLAIRLSALGRREEALAAAQEAVRLFDILAGAHGDAVAPDLAISLNNLATKLSELGRREEALAAVAKAVQLRRALAAARPDAFTPNLALSLINMANRLNELRRPEEALEAAQESVELYRALAAGRSDAFTAELAGSLTNMANLLSDLGRRTAALPLAEEAVELYRGLTAARPDAFTPNLAVSLNNLANRLSDLGRRNAALAAAEESVALNRTLAVARPEAFTPDLAMSLSNLANRLSNVGREEAALAVAEEAAALYRALAALRPEAFVPELAGSLSNMANRLSRLGRLEAALEPAQEALRLRRALAGARPDIFKPDLATSLHNTANTLSELGRWQTASPLAAEAAALYRTLVQERPEVFTPYLAGTLWVYGQLLAKGGEPVAATDMLAEGIALLTPHLRAQPDSFRDEVSGMVHTYRSLCDKATIQVNEALLEPVLPLLATADQGGDSA